MASKQNKQSTNRLHGITRWPANHADRVTMAALDIEYCKSLCRLMQWTPNEVPAVVVTMNQIARQVLQSEMGY